MTGKEALNLLFCTSEGLPEYKVYECKKILEKELDLLTKYKMAFEIFKDKFSLDKTKISKETTLYFLNGIDSCYEISKEEYELLEELMRDEKIN